MTVHLAPLQWADLTHIADMRPIGDADGGVLEEVREILDRHDCLNRFGLTLLHSHFDLASDEVMLETTDAETREQIIRPVRKADLEVEGVRAQTTVIRFHPGGYKVGCVCDQRVSGHTHRYGQ